MIVEAADVCVDGSFCILHVVLGDFVARVQEEKKFSESNRVVIQIEFVFLMCACDGVLSPVTDFAFDTETHRHSAVKMFFVPNVQRRFLLNPAGVVVVVEAVLHTAAEFTIEIKNFGVAADAVLAFNVRAD